MENEVNMKCNLVWSVTGRDWFVMSVKEGLVSVQEKAFPSITVSSFFNTITILAVN